MSVAAFRQNRNAAIEGMKFGFLSVPTCCGVLRIFANREADPPASFTSFKVVGTFRMALWLAVYQDDIGPNAAVGGQYDGAVSRTFSSLDAFCEVDFAGLRIGHWDDLRTNSVSR